MKISSIKPNIYKPNFSSSRKTLYKTSEEKTHSRPYYSLSEANAEFNNQVTKIVNANCTYFFRSDIPWYHLSGYLQNQYPQGKVNIYSLACSDGSEAYSIIIDLIAKLGEEEAKRFFPIKASDFDSVIIKEAKSGKIYASKEDIDRIQKTASEIGGVERFFEVQKLVYPIKGAVDDEKLEFLLRPKEILTQNVVFECKDAEEAIDEIQGEQNFILARNFWKYLSAEKCANATLSLRKNMGRTDRLMLGNFDYNIGFPYFTKRLGLIPDGTYFHNDYINVFKVDETKNPYYLYDSEAWLKDATALHKIYSPFEWK